ncbi:MULTISPECIES: glucose 1-dehydrogenase [unclassified Spirosoma]|uniref:glucose 1-dehydrogenase n=1 Tax=unclassified Spirosoma TaxID=2621999 RepID=UPI0009629D0B|nr:MULTISPECIES: glucose 1-dehydrogenase [unclassified Spirosoma]MBN8822654.1 glucose 1-dehydrogenase [Spirosoma sp.]OJW74143.1 MAG: short-chain dehydrogenase [Spirosoma sp. 48-14]
MSRLSNKIAVITGGNSGIGFATAQQFIAEGANVIITGRNQQAIDEAVKKLGDKAIGILSDASSISDTEALVETVKARYGRVDVLVVNAGVNFMEPVGQITEKGFDYIANINLKGAIFTVEKFIPILAEGASVINITSVSAFVVGMGTTVYAASKAALTAYSRTAAIELAPRKIRVNTIAPAMTETEIFHKGNGTFTADMIAFTKNKMPFKRYGHPAEVAKLAVFLASDDASFISGSEYVIDGAASVNEPFRV